MITVNATSGNQVEGLKLDDDLINALWPNATDAEKATGSIELTKLGLLLHYAIKSGEPFSAAQTYVDLHTSVVH